MRIHTDKITVEGMHDIIRELAEAGKVSPDLRALVTPHGSKSHTRALELVLVSSSIREGEKRRRQNAYGVPYGDGEFGGTWSEWGWVLAAMFDADYNLAPRAYADRTDFDSRTAFVFDETIAHYRIPASGLVSGDVLVGDNIPGSGVKTIEDVWQDEGARSLTVEFSEPNRAGYRWTQKQQMNPKRMVTVARDVRYVSGDPVPVYPAQLQTA